MVGLAGLVCWFHEAWPETAALALVELACGVVLFFEDRYPGNGERPLRGAEWVAADIVVKG